MRDWYLVLCALVVALTACESSRVDTETTVTDSAGVHIVTNADSPRAWGTSDTIFFVGGEGAPAWAAFSRIGSGVLVDDGSVVVADVGLREVHRLGPSGDSLGQLGAQGEGPGEFRFPARVWTTPGDSIWVWDSRLRRLTLFDPAARHSRTAQLEQWDGLGPQPIGPRDDGEWFLASYGRRPDLALGLLGFDSVVVSRADQVGERMVDFPAMGNTPRFGYEFQGRLFGGIVVFSPSPSFAVVGSGWMVGRGDLGEWWLFDEEGNPRVVSRFTLNRRQVEELDRARYREGRLATAPQGSDLGEWTRAFEQFPYADSLPRFDVALSDNQDRVWLRRYKAEWEHDESWMVFTSDGLLVGTLDLDSGSRLLDVDSDRLLTVHTDQLDVPVVQVRRFTESP